MNLIPVSNPNRISLANELHARPLASLKPPCRVKDRLKAAVVIPVLVLVWLFTRRIKARALRRMD